MKELQFHVEAVALIATCMGIAGGREGEPFLQKQFVHREEDHSRLNFPEKLNKWLVYKPS